MKAITYCILILLTFIICCEQPPQAQECIDNPLKIISLIAEQDTIESGMDTKVTAIAEGYKITYSWSADRGYIVPLENDNEVKYLASPCAIGEITITCEVTDYCENSVSENIAIVVQ